MDKLKQVYDYCTRILAEEGPRRETGHLVTICTMIEDTRHDPGWETPAEYTARTGEEVPDDCPVWFYIVGDEWHPDEWVTAGWGHAKEEPFFEEAISLMGEGYVYLARTGMGAPEVK